MKLRDAHICNVKLFLLLCVVYGHWIEPWIRESGGLMTAYRTIYLVHMPLFSFLSGLYLKTEGASIAAMRRSLAIYLPAQLLAVALPGTAVAWHTPFWHLWYLLSLSAWSAAACVWHRCGKGRGGWLILLMAVAAGCAAGYVPWLTRVLSGSRTVVFFPYFWLGVLCPAKVDWSRLRLISLTVLLAACQLCGGVWEKAGVSFLYHAAPYGTMEQGALLRLGCYVLGGAMGLFLLAWIPSCRLSFSWMAADTMPVYLLHGPMVALARVYALPEWAYPAASAGLIWMVSQALRWWAKPCGMISEKRRCSAWRDFHRSMKDMPGRSTASSCR